MSVLSFLLDLIYPENCHCLKCKENYLHSEITGLCQECLKQIIFLKNSCQICGRGLLDESENLCHYCQDKRFYFAQSRSIGLYSDLLKEMILQFKYEKNLSLLATLVEIIETGFREYYRKKDINQIVYVPIHKKRFKQRGFNQAKLLSEKLSEKTKIELNNGLKRVRETPALYNYAFDEREEILKDSFALDKQNYDFKDKKLLLVDDVFTTGATCNELSKLLKIEGKAKEVYVITLATANTY